jgi:hypothetical protein
MASSITFQEVAAMGDDKIRENRLRRMAERQGLRLVKSRRRDPRAVDYGGYMLVDLQTSGIVVGTGDLGRPHWSLDDVEDYLTGER